MPDLFMEFFFPLSDATAVFENPQQADADEPVGAFEKSANETLMKPTSALSFKLARLKKIKQKWPIILEGPFTSAF